MGMKSANEDGGDCWRMWYRTRREHLLRLSGPPPQNLSADQIKLTVCCRYARWLLDNPRVVRYLSKNHAGELRRLRRILTEFDRTIQTSV
jgi:hypothetical protein